MDQVSEIASKVAGVDQVISISGVSALDNNSTLANAGVAYIVLKDWSLRGKGEDLRSLFATFNREFAAIRDARVVVFPPPPIQGIGNAGGFAMQLQLRDGSFDLAKLQSITNAVVKDAQSQTGLQRVTSSFRSTVPQLKVEVDRAKVETLQVTLDDVFSTLAAYLGSSYVDQFNKFGRTFQVYVQADSRFRLRPEDIELLPVRNKQGSMIPLGTMVSISPAVGPSLLSLYNLYPSSTVMGLPAAGFSSGEAMGLMEEIARRTLPSGTSFEWTAMSYQEKLVGNQIYYIFALAMLLVYLVLAGQYESWFMPVAVILAVPLSLLGPVIAARGARHRQQSLHPDRSGAADRAVGQERHPDRRVGARAQGVRRQADHRGRGRGGADALPPDPHDLVRLHPRRGAAGAGHRRRRQRPQVDRHRGVQRHARLHLPGGAVRAVVLRGGAPLRGMAGSAQGRSNAARGGRVAADGRRVRSALPEEIKNPPRISPGGLPLRAIAATGTSAVGSSVAIDVTTIGCNRDHMMTGARSD